MRLACLLAAAIGILGLCGCNNSKWKKTGPSTWTATTGQSQAISVSPTRLENGLVSVVITYEVRNAGTGPATFNFPSAKQFDIWVICNGKEVFRESDGKMYTQALTSFTLQPGESKSFSATWTVDPKSAECGEDRPYEIHAELVGQKLKAVSVALPFKEWP